jgi:hypothetical protein
MQPVETPVTGRDDKGELSPLEALVSFGLRAGRPFVTAVPAMQLDVRPGRCKSLISRPGLIRPVQAAEVATAFCPLRG